MSWTLASTLPMAGGGRIPRVGLGVFRTEPGASTREAVRAALELGYRHVDTARIYRNERDVGAALAASAVPRDELFVTTKLWNDDQGYDAALRAFDASLADLGLDHVDLYLVHWPVPEKRRESWRALERLHAEGRARAIGVSNYVRRHLEELAGYAHVPPAVNQIELHPFAQQRDAVAWCEAHGVVVAAYSPLTKGRRLDHPVLVEIAAEANVSVARVLVRWSLQRGFVVLPKSARPERIAENADVFGFELSAAQMARLDALEAGLHLAWDPTHAP